MPKFFQLCDLLRKVGVLKSYEKCSILKETQTLKAHETESYKYSTIITGCTTKIL